MLSKIKLSQILLCAALVLSFAAIGSPFLHDHGVEAPISQDCPVCYFLVSSFPSLPEITASVATFALVFLFLFPALQLLRVNAPFFSPIHSRAPPA